MFNLLADRVTAIASLNENAARGIFTLPISLVKPQQTLAGIQPVL
jgi:hypothetical protein